MLRDELLVAVRSCPQNDYDTRMLIETIVLPIIERALAAERAEMKCGHPHACLKTRPFVPSDYPYEPPLSRTEEFCTACERLAAERAATIEEVRTAVSDLMARTVGRDYKIYSPGLKDALSLLKTLPRDRSALDEMLAKARREQRRENAAWLKQYADKYYADESDWHSRIALRIAADSLQAQED